MITDANNSTMIQSVVNVIRVYNKRGLRISTLHLGVQFDTSRIQVTVEEFNATLNPVLED